MRKLQLTREQIYWILTICPSTGDEVVGSGWKELISTAGGQATWWQCPSCGGWHLDVHGKGHHCAERNIIIQ